MAEEKTEKPKEEKSGAKVSDKATEPQEVKEETSETKVSERAQKAKLSDKKEETKESESKDASAEDIAVGENPDIKVEKDTLKEVPTEEAVAKTVTEKKQEIALVGWKPKTSIGKKVQNGEIKDIDDILNAGNKILEAQIVDVLLPKLETDLLLIGQAKGKFGGGKRRVFKQTQKKTREGNKPKFATISVAGNLNGYVGIGHGKSRETVPAREKAVRNAKLNIFKIRRGCGDWQCGCKDPHSIPFVVEGKCGSVIVRLIPAPKGKGLIIEEECGKILKKAGIHDVWSKTFGHTATKVNLIFACVDALKKLTTTKISGPNMEKCGMVEGKEQSKNQE